MNFFGYERRRLRFTLCALVTIAAVLAFVLLIRHTNQRDRQEAAELRALHNKVQESENAERDRLLGICDQVKEAYQSDVPGIICWGDNLASGNGEESTAYPQIIHDLLEENITSAFDINDIIQEEYSFLASTIVTDISTPDVLNLGVFGEDTVTILGRNGAVPYVISENFTVPAEEEPVEIMFRSKGGEAVAPLLRGYGGINYASIGGVVGTLVADSPTSDDKEHSYFFTRKESGEAVEVPAGTEILTGISDKFLDYIVVISMGQNGGWSTAAELISQQKAILSHQTENADKYIIVGIPTGTTESQAGLEAAMEKEYGRKFINLRQYMCTDGLADAGIKPTAQDQEAIKKGVVPPSLFPDNANFTVKGNELIGKLIYSRMDELGYFDEVKGVIGEVMP